MDWEPRAQGLAERVSHPGSRWRPVVAALPRHAFVPRWWEPPGGYGARRAGRPRDLSAGWELRDGPLDEEAWLDAAYSDVSLVTRVGTLHADHATSADRPTGLPTSSSTMPGLIVQLARYLYLDAGHDVLDVGTGSGYGCALLATRLDEEHVTSVDVDEYLTSAAAVRLASVGLHPRVLTGDATGPLPGPLPGAAAGYDRILATVAVRPVPASWLAALRPGGRLVTTLSGTMMILTADKTADGGATGRVEWERAGFMRTRTGPGYPPSLIETGEGDFWGDGDEVSRGRYPMGTATAAGDIWSMLSVLAPGSEHAFTQEDGVRTVLLMHPDGSWARASGTPGELPVVQQKGPRRLWDLVDKMRDDLLRIGELPVYGAAARVRPDGVIELTRGRWQATIDA
jgi:protein-L-isoaspartate O-methyltransferase